MRVIESQRRRIIGSQFRLAGSDLGIAIGVLLALLAIGVVVYPFVRSKRSQTRFQSGGAGVARPEEAALEEIRTLQLERELGRVDEVEYQERLRDYRVRAASLLRDKDLRVQEADAELEAEILSARSIADDGPNTSDESAEALDETPDSHENDGPSS